MQVRYHNICVICEYPIVSRDCSGVCSHPIVIYLLFFLLVYIIPITLYFIPLLNYLHLVCFCNLNLSYCKMTA